MDVAIRARPASQTPESSVEQLSNATGIKIPGSEKERQNRLAGLGPMLGIAAGVGTGAVLGAVWSKGWGAGRLGSVVAATVRALAAGNAPMIVLGVSDPRSWSASDWVSDVVPHFCYGAVTAAAWRSMRNEVLLLSQRSSST